MITHWKPNKEIWKYIYIIIIFFLTSGQMKLSKLITSLFYFIFNFSFGENSAKFFVLHWA
jgi:hypothetical protein